MFLSPVNYSQSRTKQQPRSAASPIENRAPTWESIQMHVEMRRSEMWQRRCKVHHLSITSCQPRACSRHMPLMQQKVQWCGWEKSNSSDQTDADVTLFNWFDSSLAGCLNSLHSAGIFHYFDDDIFIYLFIYQCIFFFAMAAHTAHMHSGPTGDCTHSNTR